MTGAQSTTEQLGGKWMGTYGLTRCPAHEDREPSLSLADGANGNLLLKCHAGCSYEAVRDAMAARGLIRENRGFQPLSVAAQSLIREKQRQQALKRSDQARDIWRATTLIRKTPAEAYLRGRGITCALSGNLAYAATCWHQSARRVPALISKVEGGDGFAVHRTYLLRDGSGKADLSPNKAMLGATKGGAVRLMSDAGPLVVAEGIETALSLACGLLPGPMTLWAALSAGGMKALRLPARPGELIIAPDGDQTGGDAAKALAARAHDLGWNVSLLPASDGMDWNDVLNAKTGENA